MSLNIDCLNFLTVSTLENSNLLTYHITLNACSCRLVKSFRSNFCQNMSEAQLYFSSVFQGFKHHGIGTCRELAGTVWHSTCHATLMGVVDKYTYVPTNFSVKYLFSLALVYYKFIIALYIFYIKFLYSTDEITSQLKKKRIFELSYRHRGCIVPIPCWLVQHILCWWALKSLVTPQSRFPYLQRPTQSYLYQA